MSNTMPNSHPSPEINVTPLIDVLLVLLIIFMVISPLKPHRFKALIPSEPQPDGARTKPHPDTLVVTINKNLQLRLNAVEGMGSVDDTAKLSAELIRIFAERRASLAHAAPQLKMHPDALLRRLVFIKAPQSIPYGEVIKVIDALKATGAQPIGLQIDDLD